MKNWKEKCKIFSMKNCKITRGGTTDSNVVRVEARTASARGPLFLLLENLNSIRADPRSVPPRGASAVPPLNIYHAVDFTDYYLCTKFVVSCHRNLNFP